MRGMRENRVHPLVLLWALSAVTSLHAQAFDCVRLNQSNTDIFNTPDECFFDPEDALWCNCVRSLFTQPVRGMASGFNQATVGVVDQPGVGNLRVEVRQGTLDLSGVSVGDVIGDLEIHELIPEDAGVPPGTFFTIRSNVVVTETSGESVEFEVRVDALSPAALLILTYDPTDADHSDGLHYEGRLTSLGPNEGFTLEYRYPRDRVSDSSSPAIELGDAADPGFTARVLFRYFTTETGIYTLPDDGAVEVSTTARRFFEDGHDEILDVGAADLCVVLGDDADQEPCKTFFEELPIKDSAGDNSPPRAEITVLDPISFFALDDPAFVSMVCDTARVFCVGGNSDDGDGGLQGLDYTWSILSGPEGGASIPAKTQAFKDTEITFSIPGEYEIGLTVDDGEAADNVAETSVAVIVEPSFLGNVPPLAVVRTTPDPPRVTVTDGVATLTLDGSESTNGDPGVDDCMQELSYLWRQTEGPAGAEIVSPMAPVTEVRFILGGSYVIELEVDDGAADDNIATEIVEVEVDGPAGALFRRGDVDGDGVVLINDPIAALGWLFLGSDAPACLDAADADDSADINLTDAVLILSYLFLGDGNPAPPGPSTCGDDPNEDDFAACLYDAC